MILELNGNKVDLAEGEVIAMTFQINDIAELKDRQASYSNQFRLKDTPNNIRITGHSSELNSMSNLPYTKPRAVIIEEGLEIVSNGQAIIEGYDGDINATVYAGIFDFFSQMGNSSIRELDFSELDHLWTAEVAGNSKDNTSGYIYALAQFGMVSETGYDYPINYSLPSVFVHTIIDKIFSKYGFLKTGAVLNDAFYKSWAIPCNGDLKRDAKFIEDRTAYLGRSFFDYHISSQKNYDDRIRFDIASGDYSQGASQRYNFNTAGYTADVAYAVDIEVNLTFDVYVSDGKADLRVRIYKNGNEVGNGAHVNQDETPSGGDVSVVHYLTATASNVVLSPGDEIWAEFYLRGENDGPIPGYEFGWSVPSSSMRVTPLEDFVPGSHLNINQILPDIKQKDLVKYWAHYYGIIFQADNYANSLDCRRFQEIADAIISNSVDWSDKLDISRVRSLEFRLSGYARTNYFKYNETDDTKEVGRGALYINDEALEKEATVIEAPFQPLLTQMGWLNGAKTGGLDLPVVNKWVEGQQQSIEPAIFSIDRVQIGTITYVDGINSSLGFSNTNVPVANFKSMSFAAAITSNYQAFKRVLEKTKIVTAYFNLSTIDIQSLDFFRPVYLRKYSEYFYLNTVHNYVAGRSTKVTLVRL